MVGRAFVFKTIIPGVQCRQAGRWQVRRRATCALGPHGPLHHCPRREPVVTETCPRGIYGHVFCVLQCCRASRHASHESLTVYCPKRRRICLKSSFVNVGFFFLKPSVLFPVMWLQQSFIFFPSEILPPPQTDIRFQFLLG